MEDNSGYITDIPRQSFRIGETQITSSNISLIPALCPGEPGEKLYQFLSEWFNDSPTLTVRTSGSTGAPKQLTVKKARMVQSACMTCSFLHMKKKERALLCMFLRHIGAQMMVVRALVAGLELIVIPAGGHPLAQDHGRIDLAAMVPLQIYNTLSIPVEAIRLRAIGKLLIGGGTIDPDTETQLASFPGKVYSTYGMTETLSHIALRQLNGKNASSCYTPLPGVTLSLSNEQTLVINAPQVSPEQLQTNDIAELKEDGGFRILGRKDNIINSGGIKIQIELIEEKLRPHLSLPFAVTAVPDSKFGEAVVLLTTDPDTLSIRYLTEQNLSTYERPRHILTTPEIPMTDNGKIDRKACRTLAFRGINIL